MRFEQLNLIAPLLAAVKAAGYETPSPIQQKTIPLVLAGKDVLGCAQTGTGKTAAFALPILQRLHKHKGAPGRPIRALILTPTRELAIQIFENFEEYGKNLPLRCAVIFGGVNQNPQVAKLKAGVDILIATPGRLNDLIGQGFVKLDGLSVFVLDEADRMLDMGFIHDVRKVIAKLPEKRQTLFFSATMPKEVEELAMQLLHDPATVRIAPALKTVDAIGQSVCFVEKAHKPDTLLWLLDKYKIQNCLVFTRTKHGANQLATKLVKAGVDALAIHGNKSQNARQEALHRFKSGNLRVLVATDIAARGIDVANLPFVINYNVPDTPETYVHRIGRTGRAGAVGKAVTLVSSEELKDWQDIEKNTKQSVPVTVCPWSNRAAASKDLPKSEPIRQKTPPAPAAERPKAKKAEAAPAPLPKETAPTKPVSPASGRMANAYANKYGSARSRTVRPFQSRASVTPKAEDFPPPPSAGNGRLSGWSADDLPERKPVADMPDDPAPKAAPKNAAPPAANTADAPAKKRRHRGGKKHRKHNAEKEA